MLGKRISLTNFYWFFVYSFTKDGFDSLSKHTANEIQFCKDILKFFKKKKDIEEEYGKALEKLAKKAEYTNPHG